MPWRYDRARKRHRSAISYDLAARRLHMSVEVKRPDLPKYPRSWLLDINVLSKDILGSMRRTANSEEFNAHHSKWSADFIRGPDGCCN